MSGAVWCSSWTLNGGVCRHFSVKEECFSTLRGSDPRLFVARYVSTVHGAPRTMEDIPQYQDLGQVVDVHPGIQQHLLKIRKV